MALTTDKRRAKAGTAFARHRHAGARAGARRVPAREAGRPAGCRCSASASTCAAGASRPRCARRRPGSTASRSSPTASPAAARCARGAEVVSATSRRPPGAGCSCSRGCRVVARCRPRSGPPAIAGCCSCCRAPDRPARVRGHPGLVARAPPGRSTSSPAAFGALACCRRLSRTVRSSLCAMALLSCSRRARRRLARHDRGALPLLRDGRRARALRGVVGVPAGDRLRRAPARRRWARFGRDRLHHDHDPWRWAAHPRRSSSPRSPSPTSSPGARASASARDRALRGTLPPRVRRRAGRDGARLPARARPAGQPRAARAHRPRAARGPVVLGLRARRRPRRAARELAARADGPRPSAATCAPTARSAGSCGATR